MFIVSVISKVTVTSCSFSSHVQCVHLAVADVVLFQLLLLRRWHFTR